jgi:hypothetical protein
MMPTTIAAASAAVIWAALDPRPLIDSNLPARKALIAVAKVECGTPKPAAILNPRSPDPGIAALLTSLTINLLAEAKIANGVDSAPAMGQFRLGA